MARHADRVVTVVQVSRVTDFAMLGERWRALEPRAAASFFQSWSWVGCLAAERFPDPVLVSATEDGRTVALALFNRRRRRVGPDVLYLHESGMAALDTPYVEQNGVLTEAGREEELSAACLRAVAASNELVLSGATPATMQAARQAAGLVVTERRRMCPWVDLRRLRVSGGSWLAERSANTRHQIRRSDRLYEREGAIEVTVAGTVAAGLAMLDEMAVLHQAAWQARGQPGSFATAFFHRFHRSLIAAALPRGEVALIKVCSGQTVIGVLYNLVYRNRMLAYQSGFAFRRGEPRAKPGLTCHGRAIGLALERRLDAYDFLAGEDRYKRSLAEATGPLGWIRAGSAWSPSLLYRLGRNRMRAALLGARRWPI